MAKYTGLLITIICIDLMLTLSGKIPFSIGVGQGNSLNTFFTAPNNDLQNGVSINTEFQGVLTNITQQSGGATTGLGFIDGIKMVLGVFAFLLVSVTAPLQLLLNPAIDLPLVFRLLFGIPLTILSAFALIGYIRGNE